MVAFELAHVLSHRLSETRKIGLFWRGQVPVVPACCPIAAQEFQQIDFSPQNCARDGEHAREAMAPLGEVAQVAQENIGQERHPNLPAHGVGVVSQEVGDLQRLFDLLEEDLDLPAAAVKVRHGVRTPQEVIRQEDHFAFLPVHFHPSDDPAHDFGRGFLGIGQRDQLVGDDLGALLDGQLFWAS